MSHMASSISPTTASSITTPLINGETAAVPICTPVYSSAAGKFRMALVDGSARGIVIGVVLDVSIAAATSGSILTSGVLTATTAQWDAVCGTSGGLAFGQKYYGSPGIAGKMSTTVSTAAVIEGLSPTTGVIISGQAGLSGFAGAVAVFNSASSIGPGTLIDDGTNVSFTDSSQFLNMAQATIDMQVGHLVNLVDPTNPQDGATKAYVDAHGGGGIGGSGTSGRSARFSGGTTTIANGAFTDDGTNATIGGTLAVTGLTTLTGGVTVGTSRLIQSSALVANVAIANTETVVRAMVIPANTLAAGTMISFYAQAANGGSGGNPTSFRLRFGPTTLTGTAILTETRTDSSQVLKEWSGVITFRTIGATGTVIGYALYRTPDGGGYDLTFRNTILTAVTVDTTVANRLEITYISGNAASTYTFYDAFLNQVF